MMQDPEYRETEDGGNAKQAPQLSSIEVRVLGSIMEKQLTIPDQYPLTVNSILIACNQKSSRDPVTHYQQGELIHALQSLENKRFIRKEFSSRADKYSQQFVGYLELSKKHQAVLCIMMLRGPQTLSELSSRTQRMNQFTDKDDLAHCIERLCEREIPYCIRLGQQPGQRGERFSHLFNGTPDTSHLQADNSPIYQPSSTPVVDQDSLEVLESELNDLNDKLQNVQNENTKLRIQLEKLYELTGHSMPSA